ncbi:hypothetical protein L0244_08745, partial [bacterium]|nr:hypothetical protein [bacterium]
MARTKFSDAEIEKITGAKRHEKVKVPFYYAPPYLEHLKDHLEARMHSTGGRPTLEGAELVRKVRFSKKDWRKLKTIAETWSKHGTSATPAQVAGTIVEKV